MESTITQIFIVTIPKLLFSHIAEDTSNVTCSIPRLQERSRRSASTVKLGCQSIDLMEVKVKVYIDLMDKARSWVHCH